MKKSIYYLGSALMAVAIASCGSNATEAGDAQDAATGSEAAVTYNVDGTSVVKWKGSKIFEVGEHAGTINVTEGSLSVEGGNITAGNFTMDMNTLACTDDMPEDKTAYLIGHLRGEEFFLVDSFPTAKSEVTGCEAKAEGDNTHVMSGNLTIKDVTKNISFPAKVTVSEKNVTASGSVTINRLDWNVMYDNDEIEMMSTVEGWEAKVKNGVVGKDVEIGIEISASK